MQKALLNVAKETKESKEFNAVKKAVKQTHNTQNAKRNRGMPKTSANTVTPYMNKEDVYPITRNVLDVEAQIIWSGCADA